MSLLVFLVVTFVGTGLALLVTIATGSPTDVAIMLVWTLVFNLVTGNIVSPLVYGKTVHLHPAVVLVAIPAGSAIAGIVGMFLVVPFLGVVATIWRTVLEVIAVPRPPLDPPALPGPAGDESARDEPAAAESPAAESTPGLPAEVAPLPSEAG